MNKESYLVSTQFDEPHGKKFSLRIEDMTEDEARDLAGDYDFYEIRAFRLQEVEKNE